MPLASDTGGIAMELFNRFSTKKKCRILADDSSRFAHEKAVQAMFGMAAETEDSVVSARLSFNIPIMLHFIDLGGGLRAGLTSCDGITPDHIESIPGHHRRQVPFSRRDRQRQLH
jgi:hypothetical protein